jgi:hypothetical protein
MGCAHITEHLTITIDPSFESAFVTVRHLMLRKVRLTPTVPPINNAESERIRFVFTHGLHFYACGEF